jgi:undecaprenyl-diphosphatase
VIYGENQCGDGEGLLRQAVDRPQIAGLVAHIGRIEPMTLSAVILGAVLLLVFASLANAVAHGNTHAFDEWLIIALRTPGDLADPLGPKWLEEMTRDFTALGSTGVLALMVLATPATNVFHSKNDMAWPDENRISP